MADVYNAVCLHLVWGTQDRAPLLVGETRRIVYRHILSVCERRRCLLQAMGGTANHVHVLTNFPTSVSIGGFVKELKGASSYFVNRKGSEEESRFSWQDGYGVFPVEPGTVPRRIHYVQTQEERHRTRTILPHLERVAPPPPPQLTVLRPAQSPPLQSP